MDKAKISINKDGSILEELSPTDATETDICLICKRGHIDDLLQAGKLFRLYFNDGNPSGNQNKVKLQTESEQIRKKASTDKKTEKTEKLSRHKTGNVTPSDLDGRVVKIILKDVLKSFEATKENVDKNCQITFNIFQEKAIKLQNKKSSEIVVSEILEDILSSLDLGNNGFQNESGPKIRLEDDDVASSTVVTSNNVVPNHEAAEEVVKQILLETFNSLELGSEYGDETELNQNSEEKSSNISKTAATSHTDVPNHDVTEDIVKQILLDTFNPLELDEKSGYETVLDQKAENESGDNECPDDNVAQDIVKQILENIIMSMKLRDESKDEKEFDQRPENAKTETVATSDNFDQDISQCIVKQIFHDTLMSLELKETPHSNQEGYFLNYSIDENVKVEHRENSRKRKLESVVDSDETETVKAKKRFENIENLSGKSEFQKTLLVHYFCILFSTDLVQRGYDNEGVFGFLPEDILAHVDTVKSKICIYCSKDGATTCCKFKGCFRHYHYSCGVDNDSAFYFHGKYVSRCDQHRDCKLGRMPKLFKECEPIADTTCMICLDETVCSGMNDLSGTVGGHTSTDRNRLTSKCCGRHFHRNCIQQMALTHGRRHFQCPHCKDVTTFTTLCLRSGIYIPYRDAEWETQNYSDFYRFEDMSETNGQCDAQPCICKGGRSYNRDWSLYEIVRCRLCGSSGVHVICGNLLASNPVFVCKVCEEIETAIRVKDEVVCKEFGVSKCLVTAEKIICNSRTVRVEKGEDNDNYRIANPTLTPKTPALTPSKEKWKLKVKSFGDVTPASSGVKKKRGRPSKLSASTEPSVTSPSYTPSIIGIKKFSTEPSVTSPSFTPSIIGIKKLESPSKATDPPEMTVIPLQKKRGRPCKKSFSPQKSVEPGSTVIPVQKKRGRPFKNYNGTQEPSAQNEKCTFEQFRQIKMRTLVDLSRSIVVELPDGKLTINGLDLELPPLLKQRRAMNGYEKSFQTKLTSNGVEKLSPVTVQKRGRPRKRKLEGEEGNSANKRIALDMSFEAATSPVKIELVSQTSANSERKTSMVVCKPALGKKSRGRPKSIKLLKENFAQNVPTANGFSPGSAKRRGRPPKNTFLDGGKITALKPGPASSKRGNHSEDSSLIIPTVGNVQEATVFVDVGGINNAGRQKRQSVDNNNKAKTRKNPFFVRGKHWDEDDEIIIL